jgi:hypothetical protein
MAATAPALTVPEPPPRSIRGTAVQVVCWVAVTVVGGLEGLYGRTQYLADWISYLNVSRAVAALDWPQIFNPMWSPGYPALVALARLFSPNTAEGEWYAITALNLLICLAAYGSWRRLIRQVIEFYDPSLTTGWDEPAAIWATCCAFIGCVLCLDRVSSVCPDLLVTTLFLLASAQLISLLIRPTVLRAVALGAILGAGYWAKAVFLWFSVSFLMILVFASFLRKFSWRACCISALVFFVMFAPYVAGISHSYGQLTFGVSGPLNYAFHVNRLPHWTNWQGSQKFGVPLHPTRQLITGLPAFEFGSPFKTTYPPYNNLAYWYRGFKTFYSVKLQLLATVHVLYMSAFIVKHNPFLVALGAAVLVVTINRKWRPALAPNAVYLWPLFLPALLSLGAYAAVNVEERYLSPFCLILSLLPLLPLLNSEITSKKTLLWVITFTFTAGLAAELAVAEGGAFKSLISRYDFHRDSQWKLSSALPSFGLNPGDAVATIDGNFPGYRCHWAYVSDLRIVAEFGSVPWEVAPWERAIFDHIGPQAADEDYDAIFWKKLTSERRAQIISAFRGAGAQAVLDLAPPNMPPQPGWQKISGTNTWIYSFKPLAAQASLQLINGSRRSVSKNFN